MSKLAVQKMIKLDTLRAKHREQANLTPEQLNQSIQINGDWMSFSEYIRLLNQSSQFITDHWMLGLPCPKCGKSELDDNVAIGVCLHRLNKKSYTVAVWMCCSHAQVIKTTNI